MGLESAMVHPWILKNNMEMREARLAAFESPEKSFKAALAVTNMEQMKNKKFI